MRYPNILCIRLNAPWRRCVFGQRRCNKCALHLLLVPFGYIAVPAPTAAACRVGAKQRKKTLKTTNYLATSTCHDTCMRGRSTPGGANA